MMKSNSGLWQGPALALCGEIDTVLQLEASQSRQSCKEWLNRSPLGAEHLPLLSSLQL